MNAENDARKPGMLYWLGIGLMLLLLLLLCMVPVVMIGIAFRRSVVSLHHAGEPAAPPSVPQIPSRVTEPQPPPDLSPLRMVAERAASNILPVPQLDSPGTSLQELQITVPAESLPRARAMLLQILAGHHLRSLESSDPGAHPQETRLLVTAGGSEWRALCTQLTKTAERDGFTTTDSGINATSSCGTNTVVAEIEILKM